MATRAALPMQMQYASLPARLLATVLDVIVLAAIAAVLVAVAGGLLLALSDFGEQDAPGFSILMVLGFLLAYLVFVPLYYVALWAWPGQTVGQMAMGHKIVHRDGSRIGLLGAVMRVFAYPLWVVPISVVFLILAAIVGQPAIASGAPLAVLLFLLEFIAAAFDSERRALHDRLAGTAVVRSG